MLNLSKTIYEELLLLLLWHSIQTCKKITVSIQNHIRLSMSTHRAWYEYDQPIHFAYCYRKICHHDFITDSETYPWFCQYASLLVNWLLLPCGKHPTHLYSVQSTNHYASLKHLDSYIYFFQLYFDPEWDTT